MLAGHIGAGLAIAASRRDANAAWFVGGALLLDVALWLLILTGRERLSVTEDFHQLHQPLFDFPISHGLAAATGWAVAAAIVFSAVGKGPGRAGAALAMAVAVLSHWLLDFLVHTPGLPLWPGSDRLAGLGLWRHLPLALVMETVIAMGGATFFVANAELTRLRAVLVLLLVGFWTAATVLGMALGGPPPSARAAAFTSLASLVLICALVAALDWRRAEGVPKGRLGRKRA